jgi:hypothetical protein
MALAMFASESFFKIKSPIKDLFQKAKHKAKQAGQLLACALALRLPFKTQTISLIGYSLGSQVTKSCIKTLHYLYDSPSEPLNTTLQIP